MNFRSFRNRRPLSSFFLLALLPITMTGCSSEMSDLRQFVAAEKAKPPGPIEPLPQIQPYETFTYQAQNIRSPFVPDTSDGPVNAEGGEGSGSGITPDFNRNKEYLEQFPLDSLSMVGTITVKGEQYALIADPDGAVHRVRPGNYLGQNHGQISNISDTRITIKEIIPDGLGGWMENQAAIAIDERAGE